MDIIHLNHRNRDTYKCRREQCVVAIGFFDGMHIGHQKVIQQAKKIAEKKQLPLACISFFPHPKEILTNNKQFKYIMPITEKQIILENMGVEKFYLIEFDHPFASVSPKQFVQNYLLDLGVAHVVAGFDFSYGYRGMGNMDRLKEDSSNQLEVTKVEKVAYDGEKISSSLLRNMIDSGKMDQIHHYLGNDYQIEGEILLGNDHVEILVNQHYVIPRTGVYEVVIDNGRENFKQNVTVDQARITLPLSFARKHSIKNQATVSICWLKQLAATVESVQSV
ncbi:FAD synthetase family protein [Aquibacillus sediminis]|uniref:FAD synthetase family protein n=1 Tax=Aquibacillus sediminis TaxID=2574734 RepID=UPI0014861530|nr:FAD synthetase family protein [Aquibacillus sediminis]